MLCKFLLYSKVIQLYMWKVLVAQLCPTLCNPMDYHQLRLSTEFSRQEYWNGLPFLPWGNLPNPEILPITDGVFTTAPPGKSQTMWFMLNKHLLSLCKSKILANARQRLPATSPCKTLRCVSSRLSWSETSHTLLHLRCRGKGARGSSGWPSGKGERKPKEACTWILLDSPQGLCPWWPGLRGHCNKPWEYPWFLLAHLPIYK